uniref:hypothetical protein n=1 Tax=Streptobacillus moniliformis TaxID=34105 RepID=UPI001E3ABF7D
PISFVIAFFTFIPKRISPPKLVSLSKFTSPPTNVNTSLFLPNIPPQFNSVDAFLVKAFS